MRNPGLELLKFLEGVPTCHHKLTLAVVYLKMRQALYSELFSDFAIPALDVDLQQRDVVSFLVKGHQLRPDLLTSGSPVGVEVDEVDLVRY